MADTGAAALLVYDAMRAGAEAEAKGAPRDARHCVGIVTERGAPGTPRCLRLVT
jgi:hypothetical protein